MTEEGAATPAGIDEAIDAAFRPFAQAISDLVFVSVPVGSSELQLIVALLVACALYFTISFRFINARGLPEALRLVRGGTGVSKGSGEVSHFAALTTAVSGTVGVGNIAHVAIAVSVGGAGAAFWMVVAGILGMASKFVECTLGVLYRVEDDEGRVLGGPMFYLRRGFAERGWPRLGKALAGFYAVCIVLGCLGIGCMFQANQAYVQFRGITGGDEGFLAERGWLFGGLLAVVVAVVIVGGIKGIARVTSRIVPAMALLYLVTAWIVIVSSIDQLPAAVAEIVSGAFSPEGASGGMLGVLLLGFRRAAFSNEAGIGSSSIAHSAVRTKEPVTEGFVALLEPFIDTVIICSTTALVITVSGVRADGLSGVELTSSAFEQVIPWFPYVLAIVVILFAFSTMISWSYYGLAGFLYIVGRSRPATLFFNSVFCVFVVLGCSTQLDAVIDFSDAMVFAMALANLLGLVVLAPVVKRELAGYLERRANS